ncbi:MAG: hypothetical protein KA436_00985 [Oligoflexales bacterium]|nr:hypothetical protein [Oligoflexales bacterium]
MKIKVAAPTLLLILTSCAQLHHVQLGDIHHRNGAGTPFSIKVSETGIDLREGAQVAKAFMKSQQLKDSVDSLQNILEMFQMGPRTGNPVFSPLYADSLLEMLKAECPSGKITALSAIRESRKYPVISGEIVKINGECLR